MSYQFGTTGYFRMSRRERRAFAAGRWERFHWLRRDFFRRWLKGDA